MLNIERNEFEIKTLFTMYKEGFITLVEPELEVVDVEFNFDQILLRIPLPVIHNIVLTNPDNPKYTHRHVFKGAKYLKQLFAVMDNKMKISSKVAPEIDGQYFKDTNITFAFNSIKINLASYHLSWLGSKEFDIALSMLNPQAIPYFNNINEESDS